MTFWVVFILINAIAQVVVGIVISYGLSLAAQELEKKKSNRRPSLVDEKPPTLSTRGSWLSYLIGRRRVGPLIGWVGDRERIPAGTSGFNYKESAWHLICVGPAYCLHRILENGKIIFQGPITKDDTINGSTIDLGANGSFQIYWGDSSQGINGFLHGVPIGEEGEQSRIGILSHWPFVCYVVWRSKTLEGQPIWPQIEYDIEVRPENPTIPDTLETESKGYRDLTLEPLREFVSFQWRGAGLISGAFGIEGNHVAVFNNPGSKLILSGHFQEEFNRTYTITQAVFSSLFQSTFVYLTENLEGISEPISPYPTLSLVIEQKNDGIDLSHAMYKMLFDPWPQGIGLNTSLFDIASLAKLAELTHNENIVGSFIAVDGESVEIVLSRIMQDVGFMISLDPDAGKYAFPPLRKIIENTLSVPNGAILDPAPEITTMLERRLIDRVFFTFADRTRNFRDMPLTSTNDGISGQNGYQTPRQVFIRTIVNFPVAASIVPRRNQEEQSNTALFKLNMNRNARYLIPGFVLKNNSFPAPLRILSVKPQDISSKTEVTCMVDPFTTIPSDITILEPFAFPVS